MKKKSIVTVVNDFLYRIEKEVCWVAFLVMLILLVVQVACRYVLKMPLAWSEELARFVYVSVSFLGASIAIRESSHITINLLPSILRKFQKDEQKQAGSNILMCLLILSARPSGFTSQRAHSIM